MHIDIARRDPATDSESTELSGTISNTLMTPLNYRHIKLKCESNTLSHTVLIDEKHVAHTTYRLSCYMYVSDFSANVCSS